MAAHESTRLYTVPIKDTKRPDAQVTGCLPQLDISRCMPPAATAMDPSVKSPHLNAIASLSSNDTLASFDARSELPLVAHVDRTKVLGSGQYSTVCLGLLGHSLSTAASASATTGLSIGEGNGAVPCAIKIPHTNNLDARELGLIEAAAFWQLGPTPAATVECFGLINLGDLNGEPQGHCIVHSWPSVAEQAISGKGEWALVLEYCERGPSWLWMLENRSAMDAELFFVWARQLTLALISLKAGGMAHMDIKGHNVLLDRNGDIRLADFTAAKFSTEALGAMREACPVFAPLDYPPYTDFSGTIPYSAPESLATSSQIIRSGEDLHKMDVYSLGVTLYTLFVSGREPYATVKSSVEQMLLASKGAFWEWEERHSLTTLPPAPTPTNTNSGTAPTSPADSPINNIFGTYTLPSSPVSAAAAVPLQSLSRSLSIGTSSAKPLVRRRTLRSRKTAPKEFRKFLNGDPLPANIEALLCAMVNPDPRKRPDASEILRVLDSIEPDIFEP